MRSLMFVVVLVLIGIAGLGYYRGWFAFSTNSKDHTPSATIAVDKNKFHEDEQKAKDDMQGAGLKAKEDVQGAEHKAKEEFGNLTGKSKEPPRQP